jgi:hypothetical protein
MIHDLEKHEAVILAISITSNLPSKSVSAGLEQSARPEQREPLRGIIQDVLDEKHQD